jgi:archaemetzincin
MIELVAVGESVGRERLDRLARDLARTFRTSCRVLDGVVDAKFAHNPARGQYHSTAILERLQSVYSNGSSRLLGVTAVDLFVPIFTFVFGEAQLEGKCAIASLYRLSEERYGLPADESKLRERLTKEAAHELGHTFGLPHCEDWQCVMASSHSVELVDVKPAEFCDECARLVQGG